MKRKFTLVLAAVAALTLTSVASAKPGVTTKITRSGDSTTIVIHDARPRTSKAATPRASQSDWREIDVQAPSLTAVPTTAPAISPAPAPRTPANAQPVTWTQSYEPGPVTAAAANRTGSFGGSILSTQPFFPYPYGGFGYGYGYDYGYGYNGFGFNNGFGYNNCGNFYGPVVGGGFTTTGFSYQNGVQINGPGCGWGAPPVFISGGRCR